MNIHIFNIYLVPWLKLKLINIFCVLFQLVCVLVRLRCNFVTVVFHFTCVLSNVYLFWVFVHSGCDYFQNVRSQIIVLFHNRVCYVCVFILIVVLMTLRYFRLCVHLMFSFSLILILVVWGCVHFDCIILSSVCTFRYCFVAFVYSGWLC